MEKLTKKDLFNLYSNLKRLSKLKGVKFSYAATKNIVAIEREINAMEESMKPSDDYDKYDKERNEVAKKHSEKDEKGNPKIVTEGNSSNYDIKDKVAFDKEIEKLKAKHKSAIDSRQKQIDEYNKFLDTESDIELFKIKLSDVPEDISVEQMQGIQVLIEDGK